MKKFLSIMLAALMSVSTFALVSSADEAADESAELAAGLVSQVNATGSKIPNTYAKIKNGEDIHLGYFGGSVTNGYAGTNPYSPVAPTQGVNCWRGRSQTWLNETYGTPNGITIMETNGNRMESDGVTPKKFHAGLGGTGIDLNLYRANNALGLSTTDPIDLLFIEFSINDSYEGSQYDKCAYYMESTLRMIREKSPTTDIVVILTTDHNKLSQLGGKTVHEQGKAHIDVAEYYGIPWFWFGEYMYEFMASENEKLGNSRTLPSSSSELWQTYMADGCHPSIKGYEKYYEFLRDNFLKPNLDNENGDFSTTVVNYTVPETPYNQTEAFINGHRAYHANANSQYYQDVLRTNASDVAPASIKNFGKSGYGYNPNGGTITSTAYDVPGMAFTVKVKAKSAGMFYTGHTDKGMIQYRVDGGDWKYHNMYRSSSNTNEHFMFFEKLEEKEHTIDIILRKTSNGSAMNFRGIFVDGDSTGFGAEILEGTPNNTPLNELVQIPIVLTPTLLNTKVSGNGYTNQGSSFSVYHHGVTDTDVLRYVPNPDSTDNIVSDCYNSTLNSVSVPKYQYAVIKYFYEIDPPSDTLEPNAEGNRPFINFLQLANGNPKSVGIESADKLVFGGTKANTAIIDLNAIGARTGHAGSLKQMHFRPYGENVKGSHLHATELMNVDSITFYAEYPFNDEYDITVPVNGGAGTNVNLDGKRILPSAHKFATVKYNATEDATITLEFNNLYDLAAKNNNKTFTASKAVKAGEGEVIIPLTEIAESGQIYYYGNVKTNADKAVTFEEITFSVNYPDPDAEFSVTFDANGGEGEVPAPVTGKIGHVAKLPTCTLTNGNKLFLGWSKSPDSQDIVSEVVVPVDGMTLYAVYADAAKLTYNANGGTGTCPLPVNVVIGNKTSLLSADLMKGNAIFIGWGTTADATTAVSEITMVEGGVTVYAIYKELQTVYVTDAESGKLTYNGKEVTADYATLTDAVKALGANGGHIIFTGHFTEGSFFNSQNSSAPLVILEGADDDAILRAEATGAANMKPLCDTVLKNVTFLRGLKEDGSNTDTYMNGNGKAITFDVGTKIYDEAAPIGSYTKGSEASLQGYTFKKVIINDIKTTGNFHLTQYNNNSSGNLYYEINGGTPASSIQAGTLRYSAGEHTHNGNITVVINGGNISGSTSILIDKSQTVKTNVTGATSVIINNGIASTKSFSFDPKIKYVVKSATGGKATLAAEGGAGYAPTFLLKASSPDGGIVIDGEEVATGEYLFMPKSTGTFEVTYTAATTAYASATGKIVVDGKEHTAAATLSEAAANLDSKGGTIYFDGTQSYFDLEAVSKMGFKNITVRGVSDTSILALDKDGQPAGFGCNVTIENCKIQKVKNNSAYMRTGAYVVTLGNPNDTYPVTILNSSGAVASMESIVTANGGKYIINSPKVTFSKLGCDWSGTRNINVVAEINNGTVSSASIKPFYGGSGTLNGHFAITFNGGTLDGTALNYENGCTVEGNGIFVFNNGLKSEKAYTFAGIDYIVDAPEGIKVEVSDLGGAYNSGNAPTFTLTPAEGVEKVFVNKAEVLPVNGVYTYTPSAKGTFVVEANLVLPAITFDTSDATSSTLTNITAQVGADVTLPTEGVAKDGKRFAGWATTAGQINPEYTTTIKMPEGGITLYPVWRDADVVYVAAEGKLTYGAVEYVADYTTIADALTYLGTAGGKVIFTGLFDNTASINKVNASAPMTVFEGADNNAIILISQQTMAFAGHTTLNNVKLLKSSTAGDVYIKGPGKNVVFGKGTKLYAEETAGSKTIGAEATIKGYDFMNLTVEDLKIGDQFHLAGYQYLTRGNRHYTINGGNISYIMGGALRFGSNTDTHEGNITITVNGGTFAATTPVRIDKTTTALTVVNGAVSLIINNGIADKTSFAIDPKVEYVIKSAIGGTVELKEEGSETAAPKFLIKTDANKNILINGEVVEAANGEYTFVPAEKKTYVVTYEEKPVDVKVEVTFGDKSESSSVIVDAETGFDGRATLNIEGLEPIYLENAGDSESDFSATKALKAGTYNFTVKKPGYITYEGTITVNADGTYGMDEIPELIAGDIRASFDETEGDGKIDIDDFIRVLRGFGENNDNTLLRQCVDLNEDGAVTVADLAIIKANYGLTADAYAGN